MQSYTLRRSKRAKYMRLTVHPGGVIVVTAPECFHMRAIEKFLESRSAWVASAVARMRSLVALPGGKRDYKASREVARVLVHERLEKWNAAYAFAYHNVSIKNTKSLWGSCSRKGNLNFSYKIAYLPRELQDYIVVHELCHLKEKNHSRAFWALVGRALPEYPRLRRELKRYVLG